jgi:UDP-2-acetamido-3-amino-2,3-dideoxy-glucuronate N-acetyltransferase
MSEARQPAVACIGAGQWGRNLVRNFHALGGLRAVCDPDSATRSAMAAAYPGVKVHSSVSSVLADPEIDAVSIATPAETHGELVRSALLAGKDVFVEKPLCLDVDQGRELVTLAAAESRILMVGHLLWYHPAVLALRELVRSGELGRIRYIYSNRLNFGRIRREENILWSFAPHDISVILGLVGEMPDSVEARGGNYLHDRIADVTVSLLSFPSGVRAHVFVSWLHPFKEQKLVVVGERKMVLFNDLELSNKLVLYPHTIEWRDQMPVPNRADGVAIPLPAAEPLNAECAHFLDCIRTRATPRTDGTEALRVLSVLRQCQNGLDRNATGSAATPRPHEEELHLRPDGARVHESAYVDAGVQIGAGTTIWHFSHILGGSRVGRDCRIGQNVVIGPRAIVGNGVKIQNNVSVYEGVTLEDHVFCGPSMVFTNVFNPRSEIGRMDELRPTLVQRGASLGANCTIVCGISIGRYAFVGAGAVVLRDVPDHALVVGNPSRVVGWMCECGNRVAVKEDHSGFDACGRTYIRTPQGLKPALMPPDQALTAVVQ